MKRTIITAAAPALAICGAHAAAAEELRITNEASGVACYTTGDLLTAHGAIGFYNAAKILELSDQRRCFVMAENWRVHLLDQQTIMGAEVDMVKVRLTRGDESRRVWSLKMNFDTLFGAEW